MLDCNDGYLVQVGFAGDCFVAEYAQNEIGGEPALPTLHHRDRVLVQTPRGVELGTVMNYLANASSSGLRILRRLTREDSMLIKRLHQHKTEAVRRCQKLLAASESEAILIDVDHLFDGNSLVLHFLGPVDALGRELTDEIVRQYEAEVQSIRLSELMNKGCGPGCGTDSAEGGGCGTVGGCESCSVGCGSKS